MQKARNFYKLFLENNNIVQFHFTNLTIKDQIVQRRYTTVILPICHHIFRNVKNFCQFRLTYAVVHIKSALVAINTGAIHRCRSQCSANVFSQTDIITSEQFQIFARFIPIYIPSFDVVHSSSLTNIIIYNKLLNKARLRISFSFFSITWLNLRCQFQNEFATEQNNIFIVIATIACNF